MSVLSGINSDKAHLMAVQGGGHPGSITVLLREQRSRALLYLSSTYITYKSFSPMPSVHHFCGMPCVCMIRSPDNSLEWGWKKQTYLLSHQSLMESSGLFCSMWIIVEVSPLPRELEGDWGGGLLSFHWSDVYITRSHLDAAQMCLINNLPHPPWCSLSKVTDQPTICAWVLFLPPIWQHKHTPSYTGLHLHCIALFRWPLICSTLHRAACVLLQRICLSSHFSMHYLSI